MITEGGDFQEFICGVPKPQVVKRTSSTSSRSKSYSSSHWRPKCGRCRSFPCCCSRAPCFSSCAPSCCPINNGTCSITGGTITGTALNISGNADIKGTVTSGATDTGELVIFEGTTTTPAITIDSTLADFGTVPVVAESVTSTTTTTGTLIVSNLINRQWVGATTTQTVVNAPFAGVPITIWSTSSYGSSTGVGVTSSGTTFTIPAGANGSYAVQATLPFTTAASGFVGAWIERSGDTTTYGYTRASGVAGAHSYNLVAEILVDVGDTLTVIIENATGSNVIVGVSQPQENIRFALAQRYGIP